MTLDLSQAWLAVDCDVCGAEAFEPCQAQLCAPDCPSCLERQERMKRGESYHAGGNRERAEQGL
jgi:hypothetical protein